MLGSQPGIAASYRELGRLEEQRGRIVEAEGWYKKFVAIGEALGNQAGWLQALVSSANWHECAAVSTRLRTGS